MTDLDDAFVQAAQQTAVQLVHGDSDVLVRGVDPESGSEAELEILVGGEVVGQLVPVGDGYGVVVVPDDGSEASWEQETLESALDELGI